MSSLRTLIWTDVRLVPQEEMDAFLNEESSAASLLLSSTDVMTLGLNWPHALPERGQEWCITDPCRTELESVEWWPTEKPPCRVLIMRPIYVTSRSEFDEVCGELLTAGARNPYAT